MTATLLLYNKIVPLNRDNHRDLKLSPSDGGASFAKKIHYVPVAGVEFYQAARDYPLLFIGEEEPTPVALLGLRQEENLFLDEEGNWDASTYVPAYVRRYPFVLASGENDDDEFTVCIDDEFDGFSDKEGMPLFDSEGKETTYLSDTVTFLNQYLAEMKQTQAFSKKLVELELLTKRNLRINDDRGRQFQLQEFLVIDEEKLAKLSNKALGELHKEGFLGWIYGHLISIGNVAHLPARLPDEEPTQPARAKVEFEPLETEKAAADEAAD